MASFSQTQKNRLRKLLRYLLCRNYSAEALAETIGVHTSSKKIIEALEQLSYRDSGKL